MDTWPVLEMLSHTFAGSWVRYRRGKWEVEGMSTDRALWVTEGTQGGS